MKITQTNHWIKVYGILSVLFIALHYLLNTRIFDPWQQYVPFVQKLTMSLFLIALIFLMSQLITKWISVQADIAGNRYNLMRVIRFLAIAFSLIVAGSFLFQNLYAAAVSFGLISLILGFALQQPITSFIAWVYLIFRRTYLVGDRIQINDMRGDVVSINYLDTSMLECRGDYLGNDRRSGRIIRFPNSMVLREKVINYSGPQIPFIWDETALQVAYTSDLPFVEKCLTEAANRDFRERYPKYSDMEHNPLVPTVYFRINRYAWMEAVVSYPVKPEDTTERRNRILRYALPELNTEPKKVQFPQGTLR